MSPNRQHVTYLACVAQFLVLLDFSASNIFAPEILRDVSLGEIGGFWLMGAFALPYGAFLLIGGRLSDWIGAVNVMVAGVCLLVIGNLLCAMVNGAVWFLTARAMQGLAAALVSPASLAAVMKADANVREKSLSLYGAISSLGFSAGLIVGGLVGEYSGWRFFFAGAALCAIALLMPLMLKREDLSGVRLPSLKVLVPLATASILISVAIVGLSLLSDQGRMRPGLLLAVIALGGLILLFCGKPGGEFMMVHQALKRRSTLLPVLSAALIGAALAPMLVMLSLYQSTVMHLDIFSLALRFLPHGIACVAVGYCLPKVMERAGPRRTAIGSLLFFAAGLLCFGILDAESGYLVGVLPGMLLTAVGIVDGFVSLLVIATDSLPENEQGMVSALINVGDQIGAAAGLAAAALFVSLLNGSAGSTALFPLCLAFLAVFPTTAALLVAGGNRQDDRLHAEASQPDDVANTPAK